VADTGLLHYDDEMMSEKKMGPEMKQAKHLWFVFQAIFCVTKISLILYKA